MKKIKTLFMLGYICNNILGIAIKMQGKDFFKALQRSTA
jgi:hypothetical protein